MLIVLFAPTTIFAHIKKRDPFTPIQFTHHQNAPHLDETWIPLYFIHASQIIHFIGDRSNGFLSSYGHIHAEAQTNELWIKDSKCNIQHIKKMLAHLDQQDSQFLIKAHIITIDRRYQRSLGITFNSLSSNNSTNKQTLPTPQSSDNTFTFALAKLSQSHLLNLQLSALEQAGHATVISKPILITLNNKTASIESGAEVPYQEQTFSGATSVQFKKAVLSLKVTPQHLPKNKILLHIGLTQDKVSALTVQGVPAIETQQMHTQVITKNKQMVVLGGIFENTQAKQRQGVPILDHIPILGALFQHHHRQNEQQMLLICITTEALNTTG